MDNSKKRLWIISISVVVLLAVIILLFSFLGGSKGQSFKFVEKDSNGKTTTEITIQLGKQKNTLGISMNSFSDLSKMEETLTSLGALGFSMTKEDLLKTLVFSACEGSREAFFSENGGLELEELLDGLDFVGKESEKPKKGFFAPYTGSSLKISFLSEGETFGKCEYTKDNSTNEMEINGKSFSSAEVEDFFGNLGDYFFKDGNK